MEFPRVFATTYKNESYCMNSRGGINATPKPPHPPELCLAEGRRSPPGPGREQSSCQLSHVTGAQATNRSLLCRGPDPAPCVLKPSKHRLYLNTNRAQYLSEPQRRRAEGNAISR